jgi:hypothetical protein
MAQSASAEVVSITTLKGTGSSSSSAKVSKASKKRSKSISDITTSTTNTTADTTDTAASIDANNTPSEQRYVAVVAVRRLTFEVRTRSSDDVDSDVTSSGGVTSSATACQSDEQRVIRVAVLGSVDAVSATHHCVLLQCAVYTSQCSINDKTDQCVHFQHLT